MATESNVKTSSIRDFFVSLFGVNPTSNEKEEIKIAVDNGELSYDDVIKCEGNINELIKNLNSTKINKKSRRSFVKDDKYEQTLNKMRQTLEKNKGNKERGE